MASITSIGTGSGIDLEGLVTQIIDSERGPTTARLDAKETTVESRISAFGTLKSALLEFEAALTKFNDDSDFLTRVATTGDSALFTATADADAQTASYGINVYNLASAHKLSSGDFSSETSSVGTGILTIGIGLNSFDVTIAEGNDSLAGIRDAINGASNNLGVTANILNVENESGDAVKRLVLTSDKTGEGSQLSITVDEGTGNSADNTDDSGLSQLYYLDGDADSNLTEISQALNAKIKIDGLTATSSSNVFDDVVDGVSFELFGVQEDPDTDGAVALEVTANAGGMKNKIRNFVDAYNALYSVVGDLLSYNEETEEEGLLNGDASVRALSVQLQRALNTSVFIEDSQLNRLAQVGVLTTRQGTLEINEDVFGDSVDSYLNNIAALFSGENGVTSKFDAIIDEYTKSSGLIDLRKDGLEKDIEEITDDREKLNRRLTRIEADFRRQFAGLDILVSQLNSTSDFLQQQLAATAKIINRDNSK